jgi:hypothetical protein
MRWHWGWLVLVVNYRYLDDPVQVGSDWLKKRIRLMPWPYRNGG